jgi:hypothetical protein
MDHFAAPDVSVKYTRVCIVDSMGFGRASLDALLSEKILPTALSGSDWKRGRYRNGSALGWLVGRSDAQHKNAAKFQRFLTRGQPCVGNH